MKKEKKERKKKKEKIKIRGFDAALKKAAFLNICSQVLCNVKQYYLVAMVILPEGASGLKIFFKSSIIGSPVKRKQ